MMDRLESKILDILWNADQLAGIQSPSLRSLAKKIMLAVEEDKAEKLAQALATIPRIKRTPRLRSCVERWPEATTGEYNPNCCRFPKSCSADIYDEDRVSPEDLVP